MRFDRIDKSRGLIKCYPIGYGEMEMQRTESSNEVRYEMFCDGLRVSFDVSEARRIADFVLGREHRI